MSRFNWRHNIHTPADGELVFSETGTPQGFSILATTAWNRYYPEPIIREMLQNCLDASPIPPNPRLEISVTIKAVRPETIPGIDAYRAHFLSAVQQRQSWRLNSFDTAVVERISSALNASRIPILFCRDNGVGLDRHRLLQVLTEGNVEESNARSTSYGFGCMALCAASDLRYILYAGRSRAPDGSGQLRDVASAHAILASRRTGVSHGLSGHGYWLSQGEPSMYCRDPFPATVPPLLLQELDEVEDTGSVVGVVGFTGFGFSDFGNRQRAVDAIACTAARNFLVAIWGDTMIVRIRDEVTGREEEVSKKTLKSILKDGRTQVRAQQGGGWLSGERAYSALQTLDRGKRLELREPGVSAYLQPLPEDHKNRFRVQLFRNGMWITDSATYLQPRYFRGERNFWGRQNGLTTKPFDAVVNVERGDFGTLVRHAEGPGHRGLSTKPKAGDAGQLITKLRGIQVELGRRAGLRVQVG